MPYIVDFVNVSTVGLESSAGGGGARGIARQRGALLQEQVRPGVHREPGGGRPEVLDWIGRILRDERDIIIALPEDLAPRFTFARQKSKLAGIIRGSYFVIKGEH